MLLNLHDPLRRRALRRHNQVKAVVWLALIGNNISNYGRDRRQRLSQALLITKKSSLVASLEEVKIRPVFCGLWDCSDGKWHGRVPLWYDSVSSVTSRI